MSAPNYRVLLSYDSERKVFTARAPELDHCSAEGATRADAIAHLEEEIQAMVANMRASGNHPPAAVDEEQYSGELAVKVSRQLHRDLVWQARQEGVDLDHLVAEMLAMSIDHRKGPARPGRRPAPDHDNVGNRAPDERGGGRRYGAQYNPTVFEDRANFIEYVRNLEHNNNQPQRPGGAPGRNAHGHNRGGRGPNGPRGGRGQQHGNGTGGGGGNKPL